jgi:hypothetical protein
MRCRRVMTINSENDGPEEALREMNTTCPCCKQAVTAPSLDEVIAACRLDGFEASVLRAVWAGGGGPVQTERIFDAMYADDPDGGPSPTRMYRAFRTALRDLRLRLKGTGIGIESVEYRRGHRLTIKGIVAKSATLTLPP